MPPAAACKWKLTAKSDSSFTSNGTASLVTTWPAGILTEAWPANVSGWSVPALMEEPLARSAMCTLSTASACVPNTFESRMRTLEPPILVWTIWRRVWSENPLPSPCGETAQVPTQWSEIPAASRTAPVGGSLGKPPCVQAAERSSRTGAKRRVFSTWVCGLAACLDHPGAAWPGATSGRSATMRNNRSRRLPSLHV